MFILVAKELFFIKSHEMFQKQIVIVLKKQNSKLGFYRPNYFIIIIAGDCVIILLKDPELLY